MAHFSNLFVSEMVLTISMYYHMYVQESIMFFAISMYYHMYVQESILVFAISMYYHMYCALARGRIVARENRSKLV